MKAYRTLLRIIAEDPVYVFLYIPGWSARLAIMVERDRLPNELQPHLKKNFRFFAKVCIGANTYDELLEGEFQDIEIPEQQ